MLGKPPKQYQDDGHNNEYRKYVMDDVIIHKHNCSTAGLCAIRCAFWLRGLAIYNWNVLFLNDERTRHAVEHTAHCLVGCGIGEIVGMLIASSLDWHRLGRVSIAIVLAFLFGYGLTYRGVRRQVDTPKKAIKITMATDTISILSMEAIDNIIEFIIPNALVVTAASFRFWWGLALALGVAFVVTVPVNRYMMARHSSHHH
jgi:Domain of unknown function (DUF4396)